MSPVFRFRAKDARGETRAGRFEAPSREAALERLRGEGLWVLELRETAKNRARRRARLSSEELAVLSRELSALLGAGIPLLQALRSVAEGGDGRWGGAVLEEVAAAVEGGSSLSEAVTVQVPTLPDIFRAVVSSGEAGGDLDLAFARLAEHFERETDLRRKVAGALAYPAVVLLAAGAVVALMVLFVVPSFAALFTQLHVAVPAPTRFLLGVAALLRNDWPVWLPTLLLLGGGAGWLIRRGGRRLDGLFLRLPLVGPLGRDLELSRFARTLATLLAGGLSILPALEVAEEVVRNRVIRDEISRARLELAAGGGLSGNLREGRNFPPVFLELVRAGEESGTLDRMLAEAAGFLEGAVGSRVGRLTAVLEPAVILFLGGVVGFILVSVLLPLFSVFRIIP